MMELMAVEEGGAMMAVGVLAALVTTRGGLMVPESSLGLYFKGDGVVPNAES